MSKTFFDLKIEKSQKSAKPVKSRQSEISSGFQPISKKSRSSKKWCQPWCQTPKNRGKKSKEYSKINTFQRLKDQSLHDRI